MIATCRTCGAELRHADPLGLVPMLERHRCPTLEFDPDDETTWGWLLVLMGVDPWQATICGDCGLVWPTGCHLTEALAHSDACLPWAACSS